MLKNFAFIVLLFISCSAFAQENVVTDDIKISCDGKTLTIQINDERATEYELLIYKTYEDIKIDELNATVNPYKTDISDWEPGIYHIKIDYARVTQFRHYEIIK